MRLTDDFDALLMLRAVPNAVPGAGALCDLRCASHRLASSGCGCRREPSEKARASEGRCRDWFMMVLMCGGRHWTSKFVII